MNVALFITLLTVFSVFTSICTEGCKKLLDESGKVYSSNILALIIACIVGICGTCAYYVICGIEFNLVNIICMILMGVATAMCATVGYDKVVQAIGQIEQIKIKE